MVANSPVLTLVLVAGGLKIHREQEGSGVCLVLSSTTSDWHLAAAPEEGAVSGPDQGHRAGRPVAQPVVVLCLVPVLSGVEQRLQLVEVHALGLEELFKGNCLMKIHVQGLLQELF